MSFIGISISILLLMISSVVLVMGVEFFFTNKHLHNNTYIYVLFYSIFSSLWCMCYGVIGITDNLELAQEIRVIGVFAIDGFFVVESFLVSGMSKANKTVRHASRFLALLLALIDFPFFSNREVDIFVRIGNWTTWYNNAERSFERTLHSVIVLLMVLDLLIVGIIWARNNEYKRQRRFIKLVFVANFLMLSFTYWDTFLPIFNKPAYATSGIGAAICTLVIWYGATRLNSFDIQMGNIAKNMFDFIDAGVMVFDMENKLSMANPYVKKAFPDANLNSSELEDFFKVEEGEKKDFFEKSLDDIYITRLESRFDKKIFSVRVNVAKDTYNEPYCYIVVIIDISDEINMVRELEIANNAKTMFLTSISHEIRTPLNAVLGFNEMIISNPQDTEVKN